MHKITPKQTVILGLAAPLLIVLAIWSAHEVGSRTDKRMRSELARQAGSIAAAVPIDEIQDLSFTKDDLNKPAYHRLCDMFKSYARALGQKSIYTMALNQQGQIVFGPESLDPDSSGEVYLQPDPRDFEIFKNAEPYVMGPFTDEYGTFVSAVAPVVHPQTGRVLITVGIDVDAARWQQTIRRARWRPVVMIIIPLLFLATGTSLMLHRHRLQHTPVASILPHTETIICACIAILLTAGAARFFFCAESSAREDSFNKTAILKATTYTNELKVIHSNLKLLTKFFTASDFVSRDEFSTFCKTIINSQAVVGCAWMPEVAAADIPRFEQQVRRDGFPDYTVRNSTEAEPAAETAAYPALYVEPFQEYRAALGYNIYSEPNRRQAIDEALKSNHATATAPITLLAAPGEPTGFFIYQPVLAKSQKGIVAMTIRPDMLMKTLAQRDTTASLGLGADLLELSPDDTRNILACCWEMGGCNPSHSLHRLIPIYSLGRTYALLIAPETDWFKAHPLRNWKIALIAGLILSALLTGLIATLCNRPIQLEKEVQKRTAELRASEERTDMAASAAGIGIWDLDITNNCLQWDSRMYSIYGVNKDDFCGAYEAWQACIHPDDLLQATAEVAAAEKGDKPFDTRFRIIRPDGQVRYIRAFAKVIRDHNNNPLRMTGTNQDITAELESEERFRMLFETMQTGVAIYRPTEDNRNFVFVDMNPAGLRYGLQCQDIIGRRVTDVFPGIESSGLLDAFRKVSATGQPLRLPLTQYKDSRIEQWVENHIFKLPSGLIVAIFDDITEKHRVQEKLHLQATALDQIQDFVTVTDLNGRITYVNQAVIQRFAQSADDLIGQPVEHFGEDPNRGTTQHDIMTKTRSEGFWRGEIANQAADGSTVIVDCRTQLMRDEHGTPTGMIGISSDITERKHMENELKQRLHDLERFNKAATGRELRMVELKREINALHQELGRDAAYNTTSENS